MEKVRAEETDGGGRLKVEHRERRLRLSDLICSWSGHTEIPFCPTIFQLFMHRSHTCPKHGRTYVYMLVSHMFESDYFLFIGDQNRMKKICFVL